MSLTLVAASLISTLQWPSTEFRFPRTPLRIPEYPGVFLLGWDLVQDELKLSPEIISDLKKSRADYDGQVQSRIANLPIGAPMTTNTFFESLANTLPKLSNPQKKRLGEIYLQYYDVNALRDPKVGKLIGLSASQQAFVHKRLDQAHEQYQNAQEKAFRTMHDDNEILRKKAFDAQSAVSSGILTRGIRYVMPREIQYKHTDLSRRAELTKLREMTQARVEIRESLTASQLGKFNEMKGKPISQWFFDGQNWGIAQPHPELVLNTNVQAELGFSLRQHLDIQKMTPRSGNNANLIVSIVKNLSHAQRKKLKSYGLQYDREYSILRPDISSEIGLDRQTVDKILLRIAEIDADAHTKSDAVWIAEEKKDIISEEVSNRRQEILQSADEAKRKSILDFLSVKQKKKWNDMLGKPVPGIQPTRYYG